VIADDDIDAKHSRRHVAVDRLRGRALTRGQFEAAVADAGLLDLEIRETHRGHGHASSAIVRARKPERHRP
jgi:arsenite methyltransferase